MCVVMGDLSSRRPCHASRGPWAAVPAAPSSGPSPSPGPSPPLWLLGGVSWGPASPAHVPARGASRPARGAAPGLGELQGPPVPPRARESGRPRWPPARGGTAGALRGTRAGPDASSADAWPGRTTPAACAGPSAAPRGRWRRRAAATRPPGRRETGGARRPRSPTGCPDRDYGRTVRPSATRPRRGPVRCGCPARRSPTWRRPRASRPARPARCTSR